MSATPLNFLLYGGESPLTICDDNNEIADGKGLGAIQSSAIPLSHGGCKVISPLSWTDHSLLGDGQESHLSDNHGAGILDDMHGCGFYILSAYCLFVLCIPFLYIIHIRGSRCSWGRISHTGWLPSSCFILLYHFTDW